MWALISRGGLVLLFSSSQRLWGRAQLNAAPALPDVSAWSPLPGGHGDWGCCRHWILKSNAMEVGWIQGLNVHSRCTVGRLTLELVCAWEFNTPWKAEGIEGHLEAYLLG